MKPAPAAAKSRPGKSAQVDIDVGDGPRPNILLVTIDTLRFDHTTPYGYSIPTTPMLARLAKRGVVFERMYAASSNFACCDVR